METKYVSVYTSQNAWNGRILLGFIFSFLGFLVFFVSFVMPRWNDFESEEFAGLGNIRISRIGLWQNCKMYDGFDCNWNTGITGIAAPQTFHCIAFVLFVVYGILLFRWQRQDRLPIRLLEASLCAFAIGFFVMLSFLTWITQLGPPFQYHLAIGFGFAVFSFVLMELTFVILFMESKQEARKRKLVVDEEDIDDHHTNVVV